MFCFAYNGKEVQAKGFFCCMWVHLLPFKKKNIFNHKGTSVESSICVFCLTQFLKGDALWIGTIAWIEFYVRFLGNYTCESWREDF